MVRLSIIASILVDSLLNNVLFIQNTYNLLWRIIWPVSSSIKSDWLTWGHMITEISSWILLWKDPRCVRMNACVEDPCCQTYHRRGSSFIRLVVWCKVWCKGQNKTAGKKHMRGFYAIFEFQSQESGILKKPNRSCLTLQFFPVLSAIFTRLYFFRFVWLSRRFTNRRVIFDRIPKGEIIPVLRWIKGEKKVILFVPFFQYPMMRGEVRRRSRHRSIMYKTMQLFTARFIL